MLDASAPIGGSQLLLACFACLGLGARLVLVFVWWWWWWWSLSPDALVILCVCVNWPLAAEVPAHCKVCVTLWSFYCLYRITTVLNVQYCSTLPLVAQTLLIFSTQTDFNPNVVGPKWGV